ncbi:MAG: hypothetical protein IJW92_06735 [Clostridia bacterium]|nr:hypothetical protein [Clostridia bacterium]
MRKFQWMICILILFSLLVTSCTAPGADTDGSTSQTEGTTPEPEAGAPEVPLRILYGGTGENYSLVCAMGLDNIWDFKLIMKDKVQQNCEMYYELQKTETYEILLGNCTTRPESVEAMAETSYDGYIIRFVGDKLVIAASSTDLLREAFNRMLADMQQDASGAWGLPEDYCVISSNSSVEDAIPEFETENGTCTGVFLCGDGSYQVCYSGTNITEYVAYTEALAEAGFLLYAENSIGDNCFETYVTEKTVVRVFWYNAAKSFRLVYGVRDYLPAATDAEYTPIAGMVPTVTQIGRAGASQGAAGMSYIIQLLDGSFIVVDGGPYDAGDTENLMTFLNANKPVTDEKPRVTWMVTHLHSDHVNLSFDFLKKYHQSIDLELFCWSVPDYNTVTVINEETEPSLGYYNTYESILSQYYPDTERYTFYTGDRMLLPGCTVEFLFTYNDLWPTDFDSINETSAIWRMTFDSGYSFMVTGDTYPANCNWVCKVYGELLKSDIVQTPHHGRVGSTLEFYRAVDPSIVLWSNAETYFDKNQSVSAYSWPCNAEILADSTIQHYRATFTTMINMNDLSVQVYQKLPWDQNGNSTQANGLTFAASDSYTVSKHLDQAPLTVEAVISLAPECTGRGGVIFGNYSVSGGACYEVEIFNNGVPRLYVITSTGKTVDVKFSDIDIRSAAFVHLTVVLNPATNQALCYVDGVLKQTVSVSLSGELTYPNKHMVGGDLRTGNSQYFKGTIQSLTVYSDVRTAEEIQEDLAGVGDAVLDTALLLAYDFTAAADVRLEDFTPNNNDLKPAG